MVEDTLHRPVGGVPDADAFVMRAGYNPSAIRGDGKGENGGLE